MDSARAPQSDRPWALHLGAVLAVLALALSAQLCRLHLMSEPIGCPAGGGCARILASRWSAPLGVPLALGAFALEVVLLQALARAAVSPTAGVRRWLWILLVMTLGAVALSLLLMLHLRAPCRLCLALDALMLAQAALFALWLQAQGPAEPRGRPMPPILRIVDSLLLIPALIVVAVDLSAERQRTAVVATVDTLDISRSDVDRMGVGMRQADRAQDADIDRAFLRRRLDIDLITRQAEEAHQDVQSFLREQAAGPGGMVDGASEEQAVERLHAASAMVLPPARAAVVRADDWDCALTDGDAHAPISVLAVIRADCGVCASEIRELMWCRAHGQGWDPSTVRIGVIFADDAQALETPPTLGAANDTASAVELARSIAAVRSRRLAPRIPSDADPRPAQAWHLLMRICTQADPSEIPCSAVRGWLLDAEIEDTALSHGTALVQAQAKAASRLLQSQAPPRLFLQDRALGGYCPRERLCGAIAAAHALLLSHEIASDLDPVMPSPPTAGAQAASRGSGTATPGTSVKQP